MRSKLPFAVLCFLFIAGTAFAQSTTVSGTVTDTPDGQAWFNGTYSFVFRVSPSNPTAQYFWNGAPFSSFQTIAGALDGSGHYSVSIPSNTSITPAGSTWDLTVCPLATAACFTVQSVSVTGPTQTVAPIPPSIRINLSSPPQNPRAYQDGELVNGALGQTYFNIISTVVRVCSVFPCGWTNSSGGTSITLQTNGTPNPVQSLLNLKAGSSITTTADGSGGVTISSTIGSPCGGAGIFQAANGIGGYLCTNVFESSGVLTVNETESRRGPNPAVDVTAFGAVPVNLFNLPSNTVTISASSNSGTVNGSGGYAKGYGIAISGAGPTQSMTTPSAPTVTPSCASDLPGTGYTTPIPAGSTAYAYSLVQRDQGGGYTAASTNGTTSTGIATLGANNTTASGTYTISGTTITVPVTSTANLAIGCGINIVGTTDDAEFGGWHRITNIVGSNVSYSTGMNSTHQMTSTTATGGTIYFFLCNHISYAAPSAGGTQYWIYGRSAGSMAFLKISLLANLGLAGEATYNSWDDFGATMEASPVTPWWAPASPPGSPVNDMWATTITNISGNTFTFANNAACPAGACNSVTTATTRFDDAPAILAAYNASYCFTDGCGGTIYFPPAKEVTAIPGLAWYVTSSYLQLSGAVNQGANIANGDTIEWDGGNWTGTNDSAVRLTGAGFGMQPSIGITPQGASPAIWVKGGPITGGTFKNIKISDGGNEGVGMFVTETQGPHPMQDMTFVSNDFMGVAYYYFQTPANGGIGGKIERTAFIGGTGSTAGVSATPKFISKNNTFWNFDYISGGLSGFFFTLANSGGFEMDFRLGEDWQGCNNPLITINNSFGGAPGGYIALHHTNLDTCANPLIAQLSTNGNFSGPLLLDGVNLPSSGVQLVSGIGFSQVVIQNFSAQGYTQVGQNVGVFGIGNGNSLVQGIKAPSLQQETLFYSANHTLNAAEGVVIATSSGITLTLPHTIRGQGWDIYNTSGGTVTLTIDSGTLSGNGATGNITLPANTGWHATCDGTNCEAQGGGGGGGGGGCPPGGLANALQSNGGGTCNFQGTNSPTVNGNYLVNYNVTASASVAPTINLPGIPINAQSGTTYTIGAANAFNDRATLITATNSGAQTYTAVNPSATGFGFNMFYNIWNRGTAAVTENSSGFNLNAGTSLLIPPNWIAPHFSDGVNYSIYRVPEFGAFPNCTGGGNALQFTAATGIFNCGSAASGVSSFSGDAGGVVSNATSTGAVVLTFANAPAHKYLGNNTGTPAAPGYFNIVDADLTAASHAALFNAANTWTGLQDFSGATWKIPTAGGFTAGATSMDGYDSTNKNRHTYANNADAIVCAFASAPTNNNFVIASVSSGNVLCTGTATPQGTTQAAKDNSTNLATTAYVDRPTGLTAGTSVTLTAPRQYFICTGACTITVPVPAAGYEFCVRNDNNVGTVITFAAIGSSGRYENTSFTAYGTAGTGTLVSAGAAGDKMCILGRDSTHYLVSSFNGTWVAN